MSKLLWKSLLAAPAALGAAFAVSGSAVAAESAPVSEVANVDALEQVSFGQEPVQLAQITSVSELTDVLPTDWAFQALQNLVETYGCIEGYPDRTYRGQRSLTRFEFAAGLNSCLNVIAGLSGGGLDPDDLAAIRRLQEEFQAELATLRGRVDALEAETAELRAQQFSTTTKLRGQVDMQLGVPFDTVDFNFDDTLVLDEAGNVIETIPGGTIEEDSMSVASRARLNFDSSFTGEDRLRVRLQAGQGNFVTPWGGLANAGSGGEDFNVIVDDFYYSFPLGSRLDVTVSARGLAGDDWVTSTIVPYDGPGVADASGPQFYDAGGSTSDGAGAGVSFALTDNFVIDAGYTAGNPIGATDPAVGLFSAPNQSYIAQLSYLSDGFLDAAFAYMHNDLSENFEGGSAGATNTYAGLVNFDFGNFFVAGYAAWQDFNGGDDFNWTAGVGFNDLFLEGSQLGVYGGQLPQLQGYDQNPWLVEGYYEIPFNEFLTITPALIYGEANIQGDSDSTFYGALRATFRF
jgi:hypothetical protein